MAEESIEEKKEELTPEDLEELKAQREIVFYCKDFFKKYISFVIGIQTVAMRKKEFPSIYFFDNLLFMHDNSQFFMEIVINP